MEKKSPEIQMEIQAVVIESTNASSSYYDGPERAHVEESDDKEARELKACEILESRKLAHGKNELLEEPQDEDDSVAPVSPKTQDWDPTWMTSIKNKCRVQPRRLQVSSSNISTSIHRVPRILFQRDKNAYVPQVVSIGPLHSRKRKGKLRAVEEHKWRYLNEIVNQKGEAWLEQCMVVVKKLEKEARECYSQVIDLDSYSFVEMMLLDGCFVIQLFVKSCCRQFEDDPLFKLGLLRIQLAVDLVMLENQIPFFILQTLFDLIYVAWPLSLKEVALNFFVSWPFYAKIQSKKEITGLSKLRIHHLLHLLHENIVISIEKYASSEASCEKNYSSSKSSKQIQCSSELQESGIKFATRDLEQGDGHLFGIKFDKGTIEIPRLTISDQTNTMLRNLIAFEQCYLNDDEKQVITAYTAFMDYLIDSSKDVEILVQKEIIENWLGCDEDVALLFNNINKDILHTPESSYLVGVSEKINHYCENPWPKLRATLMHDYFKNPWAVISFFAAALLLLLTFTQTFFSVVPKFAIGN